MTEDREALVRVLAAHLGEREAAVLAGELIAINERARAARTTVEAVGAQLRAREQRLTKLVNGILNVREK